uniref:Protein transport protein Sec61 subunit beta n=1 Tax=Crocodylus porosus TaxID=8502 RepID=A0A7M4DXE1_CROPO
MTVLTNSASFGTSSNKGVGPKGSGWSVRQKTTSSSGKSSTNHSTTTTNTKGIWSFYTGASHGIKIGPFTVLIISILFIACVIILHIWAKYNRS